MEYRPHYNEFRKAYQNVKDSVLKVCMREHYEDAVIVPAMLAVAANLAVLSDNTDDEIIAEFRKCLFDARTRETEKNPQ